MNNNRENEYIDTDKVAIDEYTELEKYNEKASQEEGFCIMAGSDLEEIENKIKNESTKNAYYIKAVGRCKNNGNFWLLVENAYNTNSTMLVFFSPEKLYCLAKDTFNLSLKKVVDDNGFPIGKDFLQDTDTIKEMLKGNRLLQVGKDYIKIVA